MAPRFKSEPPGGGPSPDCPTPGGAADQISISGEHALVLSCSWLNIKECALLASEVVMNETGSAAADVGEGIALRCSASRMCAQRVAVITCKQAASKECEQACASHTVPGYSMGRISSMSMYVAPMQASILCSCKSRPAPPCERLQCCSIVLRRHSRLYVGQ